MWADLGRASSLVSEPVTIVEVFYHYDIRSQVFVHFFNCECGMDVSGFDGERYGPLKPPGDQVKNTKECLARQAKARRPLTMVEPFQGGGLYVACHYVLSEPARRRS